MHLRLQKECITSTCILHDKIKCLVRLYHFVQLYCKVHKELNQPMAPSTLAASYFFFFGGGGGKLHDKAAAHEAQSANSKQITSFPYCDVTWETKLFISQL